MTDKAHKIEPNATLRTLIEHMDQIEASDLYVTAGAPPVFRVENTSYPGRVALSAAEVEGMADSLMSMTQRQEFRATLEMNLTFSLREDTRCRANLFWQRGTPGMVVRLLRMRVRTLDELCHPRLLQQLALAPRGLVLVVGGKGSGRSTTLAAMIDQRNTAGSGHIVTIEDPIEFFHEHKQCIVTQREVGFDTRSYAAGLRNALRQTPDMIFVSEIRDAEVMEAALAFADSGHLCLSTLHANNASHAIDRVLSFFPTARHAEIRMRLSQNLRAVIAQRFVPSIQGGRVLALEILIDTPRIRDILRCGELAELEHAMDQDGDAGCCTSDASLFALFCAGRIHEADALHAAEHAHDLRLRVQSLHQTVRSTAVALRLAPDPYGAPVPEPAPSAPTPDRRSKTGPVRG